MLMKPGLILIAAIAVATPALAQGHAQGHAQDTAKQLNRMELGTRVEQRCNGRATGITRREGKLHSPEEVIAYALADDQVEGTTVVAHGAAIKDGNKWYQIDYRCQTSGDGLNIVSFQYHLGREIPRQEWRKYGLSP
jgi:hypothetical protein